MYIDYWPIDSPPKMASWRTSFVGPSIELVSNIIMEQYDFQIIISIQAKDA